MNVFFQLCVCLCWCLFVSGVKINNFPFNIKNYEQQHKRTSVAPEGLMKVDTLGSVNRVLHAFLSRITNGKQSLHEETCRANLLRIGTLEVAFSNRPFGDCSYCCKLNKPKNHINLYYTNKSIRGKFIPLNLVAEAGALRRIGLNNALTTVFFVHGFSMHGLAFYSKELCDAYLNRYEDYNIILVDWADLATLPWFYQAAENTKVVASLIAKFILFYDSTKELSLSKIHLIGFSLGGHVVGFVGKYLQGKISRITALDPGFPLFPLYDSSKRLSKMDAQYVDVIHTDAGRIGISVSVGHADFYPNGGAATQPGCDLNSLIEQKSVEQFATLICGHFRALDFYIESVRNPTGFPATKCGILKNGTLLEQCRFITHGYMGFLAEKSRAQGDFYLSTNNRRPFAKSARQQMAHIKTVNLVL